MLNTGFTASGNINRSRFVAISGAFTLQQAVAASVCVGVSQEGTNEAPIPGASTLAAIAGQPIKAYGDGEVCLLTVAGALSAGALLRSDANGQGVVATTGTAYFAMLLEPSNGAGELVRVMLIRGVAP